MQPLALQLPFSCRMVQPNALHESTIGKAYRHFVSKRVGSEQQVINRIVLQKIGTNYRTFRYIIVQGRGKRSLCAVAVF